ncbi:TPA: glycosyltransferase family 25 protein [Vibrio parahaemolyticus]|nr:glycosyltransferase family 25 protein [Vibrio parahaemolyticus]MCC3780798.1 glycosyltransferase family 25 protein [Vibrio parahaemolyticus]HBC3436954.1 glycosyltransferase family 25 protein [Vibrio parahaemolyticus]HBC3451362.1 glycosyltransferase family 25 protein [Vibrio parahaemolyticus]HBC3947156.1 glycosyltransferase family 25 protein [Vibrio parahaemolyticus]
MGVDTILSCTKSAEGLTVELSSNTPLKVFVITTGNEERVNRIQNYLKGIDFEFVYSDSYDDLLKLEKEYESYSHKFRQKAIMAGEIGCFKTHSQAWELIVASGTPAIVIEDNIEFIGEASRLLADDVLAYIQSCGLVNFTNFCYILDPEKPFKISDVKEKKPFPTVCYGITPLRARDLLSSMKKTAYAVPIDKWLSIPKLSGCYGYISPIVVAKREDNLTSIANKRKGKKTFNPLNMIQRVINKVKFNY